MAEEEPDSMIYRVPRRFWDDHELRIDDESLEPEVINETTRHVYLAMTPAQLADLISDAHYYAGECGAEMVGQDRGMLGIVSSARATLKALERQGVDISLGW